ncbi:MAG TPA: glycosyltransferase family 2 protein [Candidatus Limnocylindrales bacterium]|nr:glycosyltransferase family 2 protein [Candidatus Limnocylindrales bacterium]
MSETDVTPMLSVVIPIFNEEETLDRLFERLSTSLGALGEEYEVIFVNDGSRDGSERMLREFHKRDPRFRSIHFSRNFGHQTAITCGLDHARGQAVIAMDGDLQDPPEVLKDMIARWREGYDVVYAIRQKRKEGFFKRGAYKAFYWLLRHVSYLDIPLDSGDFSLIDRRVIDILKSMPERNRFVRGLRTWAGFRQIGYEYNREARFAGESKYNLAKLMKLAFDGLVSYSYVPLRLVSNVGLLVSAIALGYMGYLLLARLFGGTPIAGWTSTVVIVLFLGGVQLLSLGVIGEYVGRIFEEVKHRPHYVVRERIGFAGDLSPVRPDLSR